MGVVTNVTDKYQKCIDACNICAQACNECFMLCLNEPDVGARTKCIAGLVECAGICKLSACFMSADAQHAKELCTLCATICDACGKECGMFKDNHCSKCSDICKACAAECKSMAQ